MLFSNACASLRWQIKIITFKNNLKYFQGMDSLIAFKGKDYVIMAADTFNAYSILRMKVLPNINLVIR